MTLAYGFIAFIVVVAVGAATWYIRRGRQTDRDSFQLRMKLADEIEPVTRAIYAGEEPLPEALERAAADPRTRNTLFEFLLFHHKLESFPSRYRTAEAFAESALVQWLMHPNELGVPPDEIELANEVRDPPRSTVMGRRDRWFVFRFRTLPPHPAAEDGWMAGVVGPVSGPPIEQFPDAAVVWSMFRPFDSAFPEEHVSAVRELARKTGVTV
jgi:hypothetical protein